MSIVKYMVTAPITSVTVQKRCHPIGLDGNLPVYFPVCVQNDAHHRLIDAPPIKYQMLTIPLAVAMKLWGCPSAMWA